MRDKEIRILCYGDSNTWGYISGTNYNRLLKSKRWTGMLQEALGNQYLIIEEGLNGRTISSNDPRPEKAGKNGYDYLIPCLDSQDPLDIVILMLGTNDLKKRYGKTTKQIGEDIESTMVKTILNRKSQFMSTTPELILICPPLINENAEYCKDIYEGASEKSKKLNKIYKKISEKYNCKFISNDNLTTGIDGVHLDEDSHKKLASSLVNCIRDLTNYQKN